MRSCIARRANAGRGLAATGAPFGQLAIVPRGHAARSSANSGYGALDLGKSQTGDSQCPVASTVPYREKARSEYGSRHRTQHQHAAAYSRSHPSKRIYKYSYRGVMCLHTAVSASQSIVVVIVGTRVPPGQVAHRHNRIAQPHRVCGARPCLCMPVREDVW